jgi:hypothetical protein
MVTPLACARCGMRDRRLNWAGSCYWCAEAWKLRHPLLTAAGRRVRTVLAVAACRALHIHA